MVLGTRSASSEVKLKEQVLVCLSKVFAGLIYCGDGWFAAGNFVLLRLAVLVKILVQCLKTDDWKSTESGVNV